MSVTGDELREISLPIKFPLGLAVLLAAWVACMALAYREGHATPVPAPRPVQYPCTTADWPLKQPFMDYQVRVTDA